MNYVIKSGQDKPPEPPKVGRGAKFRCSVCGEVAPEQHIKSEGVAKRFGMQLIAVVTDGQNGRSYYPPTAEHEHIAMQATPLWQPETDLVNNPRHMSPPLYGLTQHKELFTQRQLTALSTFSGLIAEVRDEIASDMIQAVGDTDVASVVANDLARLHRKGWRVGSLLDFLDEHHVGLVLAAPGRDFDFTGPQGRMMIMLIAMMDE